MIICLVGALLAAGVADPDAGDVAQAFMAALARRDRSAAAALIGEDADFAYPFDRSGQTDAGAMRRFVGREAVVKGYIDPALQRLTRIAWKDQDMTVSADGHRAFVEALGDMEIDGRAYRNRYVLRFETRGGRITGFREYLNPVTSALAMGLRTAADMPPATPPR